MGDPVRAALERAAWTGSPADALPVLDGLAPEGQPDRVRWLAGVCLGALGRYREAAGWLNSERDSRAASCRASHLRQVGRHAEAEPLDRLALATATDPGARADALTGLVADAVGTRDVPTAITRLTTATTLLTGAPTIPAADSPGAATTIPAADCPGAATTGGVAAPTAAGSPSTATTGGVAGPTAGDTPIAGGVAGPTAGGSRTAAHGLAGPTAVEPLAAALGAVGGGGRGVIDWGGSDGDPAWRVAVRLAWVTAEVALCCDDPAPAVSAGRLAVRLSDDAGACRHAAKSRLVLAAGLHASGRTRAAARVLRPAAAAAARLDLAPLEAAVRMFRAEILQVRAPRTAGRERRRADSAQSRIDNSAESTTSL